VDPREVNFLEATYCLGHSYLGSGDAAAAAGWFQRCADAAIKYGGNEALENACYCRLDAATAFEKAGDLSGAMAALEQLLKLVEPQEKRFAHIAQPTKLRERIQELQHQQGRKGG
jgi:hypothetical protein